MPTYVYQCKACEEQVEKIQTVREEPLRECESCGGELRKVLQPVTTIYNCGGFHKTDYR